MAKRRSDAMNASCVRPNRSASMATLSMHLRRGVVAMWARGLGVEVEEAQLLPVIGEGFFLEFGKGWRGVGRYALASVGFPLTRSNEID